MTDDTKALEKAKPQATTLITTREEYEAAIEKWRAKHLNVLTPFSTFTNIAQGYALTAAMVTIDPDPDKGEVYGDKAPWIKAGHVALAKVGLRKIQQCASMSTESLRMDNREIGNFWEFKVRASWRGLDGAFIHAEATEEWDMRDGSARSRGFTPAQVQEARKHGLRHCETRATNAAIREYGLKQMYTRDDIARPFVVLRVVYLPDHSDPETRRILTENALAGSATLYGGRRSGKVEELESAETGDYIDVPADKTDAPAATTTAPAVDGPPTPEAVKIVKVETRPFVYKNGARKGQQGERFVVVDSRGVESSTFSKDLRDVAERFAKEGAWVEISTEGGEYSNIIEISKAGTSPKLTGLGEGPL